jgi:hypothetical protein
MNKLFRHAGDLITPEIQNKFLMEISLKVSKNKFRESTIKIYRGILKKRHSISDRHMEAIVWILGEYIAGHVSEDHK